MKYILSFVVSLGLLCAALLWCYCLGATIGYGDGWSDGQCGRGIACEAGQN